MYACLIDMSVAVGCNCTILEIANVMVTPFFTKHIYLYRHRYTASLRWEDIGEREGERVRDRWKHRYCCCEWQTPCICPSTCCCEWQTPCICPSTYFVTAKYHLLRPQHLAPPVSEYIFGTAQPLLKNSMSAMIAPSTVLSLAEQARRNRPRD